MKRILLVFVLAGITAAASAGSLYQQLCAFNFNWKKYPLQAPAGEAVAFSGDREYIQAHLKSVLQILRAEPVDELSTAQKANREKMIALLDGYREAGKFPMNYYRRERIPVFIDEHGTHCAVGYLMMMTGEEEMAQRISKTDNYAWVKDIHDPALSAWQQASGLSVENLKLIQGAYDFYMPNALFLANRYETPQMPACTTAYFTGKKQKPGSKKEANIWFKGEGANGVLNGKWEQNYSASLPWIIGYYDHGKRTGDWMEFYQGTTQLCRTEQWRDNQLNGIRRRYDRSGVLIEEIIFDGGKAISKVNYEYPDSVAYVRIPTDSLHMWTQVFNARGELIACGHETVYNPGNLLWFQSIELTALNSASISARSAVRSGGNENLNSGYAGVNLYDPPPLVHYLKEGDWIYYPEKRFSSDRFDASGVPAPVSRQDYSHFANEIISQNFFAGKENDINRYDSVRISYSNNQPKEFYGYSQQKVQARYHKSYYEESIPVISLFDRYYRWYDTSPPAYALKETGQYDEQGRRIGVWNYYNRQGQLFKTETYLVPTPEAELKED